MPHHARTQSRSCRHAADFPREIAVGQRTDRRAARHVLVFGGKEDLVIRLEFVEHRHILGENGREILNRNVERMQGIEPLAHQLLDTFDVLENPGGFPKKFGLLANRSTVLAASGESGGELVANVAHGNSIERVPGRVAARRRTPSANRKRGKNSRHRLERPGNEWRRSREAGNGGDSGGRGPPPSIGRAFTVNVFCLPGIL
jgi:hypothetical protein